MHRSLMYILINIITSFIICISMSKEDSVYNAKLAEQAERYDDMVKYMKDIVIVSTISFNHNRLETN